MSDVQRAAKRLTDLVDGLRSFEDPDRNKILKPDGSVEKMSDLQARVFTAYARQIERVVEDDLS